MLLACYAYAIEYNPHCRMKEEAKNGIFQKYYFSHIVYY